MGRIARKYLDTSFFHVMVQGIGKEYIFKNERYINRYLQLFKEKTDNENINIIAFCVMNNHAHFLINTNNLESLSKYMQRVNSAYARYYNYMEDRVGYVFRDRYKSEPITSKRYLLQCVKYIHNNPVKANIVKNAEDYKYSSYNKYMMLLNNGANYELFTQAELQDICKNKENLVEDFIEIDVDNQEKIKNCIELFVKKDNIKLFEIFENHDILRTIIKYLKEYRNISYVDIMKFFSITRGTMERLKR